MTNQKYFVYILTNHNNRVLYTGMTSNLKQRTRQHKGQYKGFTSKYNINKLVYYETNLTQKEAIKREGQIKNLVRRKKIEMVNKFNLEWKDLYEEIP